MNFETNFLFASMFWGSVGVGYFVYGKKQQSFVPLTGGLVMIAVSFLVASALLMSIICIALIIAVFFFLKAGD